MPSSLPHFSFFFFNDTATTEIYTLSLHDALPISSTNPTNRSRCPNFPPAAGAGQHLLQLRPRLAPLLFPVVARSEEHTSELQSRLHLVCRLLLEKKKNTAILLPTSRSRHRQR